MNFQIIPAIDLMHGKCVRLYKGSFDQKTEYFTSPAEQAKIFEDEGADLIHVVDLDGAKAGESRNLRTIAKICESVKIPIEAGGGIRSLESAQKLFEVGVKRIILGTIAIEQPELLKEFLARFGNEKIVVGLDARKGGLKLATRGWKGETDLDVIDFAEELEKIGVKRIIYTDIARDGTLTFPNFDVNERLVNTTNLKIIASGGVTDIEHLRILKRVGCEGAILGKALYENEISLAEIKMNLKF
ncbi:MAG: 1-(5-phosphoribosyl)-5-[(5-phosphoribosylamino)methylideneamino]imidazole-4-carboxamide isomerase [Patescibacteria group bacterium]